MATGKLLKLGGMDNSLPKTDQSAGRFRVARNVLPTPDGDIIPRSEFDEIAGQSTNYRYIHYITQYDSDRLYVVAEDADSSGDLTYQLYKNNTLVPNHYFSLGGISVLDTQDEDISRSIMSYRLNNTVYFLNPNTGRLFKYDGVEVSAAGCQQPIFSTGSYVANGSKYIRIIQHCIDFDNNEPVSEYVQFQTNEPALMSIRCDGGATNIIPNSNVIPSAVIAPQTNIDSPYFVATGAVTYAAGEYTVTTSDTNILNPTQIGTYVIVRYFFTSAADSGLSETSIAIALKVKSTTTVMGVTTLKLDASDAKYLTVNREWKTGTAGTAALAALITYGSRNFFTVWASNSANGNYVFRASNPSFPYSSTSNSFVVDVSSVTTSLLSEYFAFAVSPNLGDWYDVNVRKLSPNAIYPYGSTPLRGLTAYQQQLLMWSDDLIWSSDTTLGAFPEQLNTSSFIRVGDFEFGQVMSVCGTQDFFMVSRERKNYFVNGVLPTGNYRVQEMPEAEIGAWTNNGTINVKDSVVMITAIGVFQVMGGGKTVKLSARIPKNFSRYNSAGVNEDVAFSLIGTNILSDESSDLGLSVAYDEFRELLVFMQKGPNYASNPCLVLHTATGEFYEWTGLINQDAPKYATAIAFIAGEMLVGYYTETTATLGAKILEENTATSLSYPTTYACKLHSTWLTAGEPSLEKEVCQVKVFGTIDGYVKVVHFKDWDYSTKITDATFTPISSSTYSNKQRLNADKALAISFGIEKTTSGGGFRIESLEVEFNPIQQGMKR